MPLPPILPSRYRDLRHLADGGMASVWAACDERLDREVAIKVLTGAAAADPDVRERFMREGRAAARVSRHPNVVTVYDAGEEDGTAYLVMALYCGGTVADRMRGGAIGRERALRWLRDAAAGLDAAHAQGVVHRDVKPGNLMIDADDRVAVGDFGIASAGWASSLTQTGMVIGTLAYLAPEQRAGAPATPASDRWALGVVAHQLLTGRLPGDPDTPALPRAAEDALDRATSPAPEDRFPTCAAFVGALEAGLCARTTPTAVAPAATARPLLGGAFPARAAAAGCLVAAAVVALVIGGLGGGGAPSRAAATDRTAPRTTPHTARPRTTTQQTAPAVGAAPVTAAGASPSPAPVPVPPPGHGHGHGHGHGRAEGHAKPPKHPPGHAKGKAKGGDGGEGD